MQKALITGITENDYAKISRLVYSMIDVASPAEILSALEKEFYGSIEPRHYILFGFLIGDLLATETANENLIYYQCQRLN